MEVYARKSRLQLSVTQFFPVLLPASSTGMVMKMLELRITLRVATERIRCSLLTLVKSQKKTEVGRDVA